MMMNNLPILANAGGVTTITTIIFVTGSFLILMLALKKFAWGPIADLLEKREKMIAEDIDGAKKSKLDAEELLSESQKEIERARLEAENIIKQAHKTAEANAKSMVQSAEKEIELLKKRMSQEIENERKKALEESKVKVATLSISIAQSILKSEISEAKHQALIEEAIGNLGVVEDE